MKYYSKEEIQAANSVDIESVLSQNNEKIIKCGKYFTTQNHDSIRYKGSSFVWYSKNISGHTINFVMEYFNLSFYDSVRLILNNNPIESTNTHKNIPIMNEKTMCLEEIKESYNKSRAIAYLCKTRGISYNTVINLIRDKTISLDIYGNIIFKAYDDDNVFVGGELRSCNPNSKYRRIIGGTKPGYGVKIMIDNLQKGFFFENSIDMISFFELYQSKLHNCILISMGGLKQLVVETTLKRFNLKYSKAVICVDNDEAGHKFIEKIKNQNNVVKNIFPKKYKDWNEYLLFLNEKEVKS